MPTRCTRCAAPLASPARANIGELFGRRADPRAGQRQQARIWRAGDARVHAGVVVDLSLSGVGLLTSSALPAGERIRVLLPRIDLVAEVLSSSRVQGGWRVHARQLAHCLEASSGAFVSTTA
ncbi:MAG: PilZ domain-containing protein [Burkholderiaceae bacterium]